MILWIIFLFSCVEEQRRNFLAETLWMDNRKWLYRDPALFQAKLNVMAESSYNFMRGTQRLHWVDGNRPQTESSSFLQEPESRHVLIFGDPHPENWGVQMNPEGTVHFEMMDLDGVEYGPWIFDLRRLSLGVSIIQEELVGCDCTVAEQVALGYSAGLSNVLEPTGSMYRALVVEGREEGTERKRFENRTEEVDGVRRFTEDRISTPLEVMSWADQNNVRILDVRRLYAGVSSYSALRYLVLWDNGEEGDSDDRITQIRELSDAVLYTKKSFSGHEERLVVAQEELWLSPHQDWGHDIWGAQGLEWKSFFYESSMQDFDHKKIREAWDDGDIGSADLEEWGYVLGYTLANRHVAGTTRNGLDVESVITRDIALGGGEDVLVDEVLRFVKRDLEQINTDFTLFQELVEEDFWTLERP